MIKQNNSSPENQNNDIWKLYELLLTTLQHYHSRWIDNYRIFLSFNAFLLPAMTALLAYSIKENESVLYFFVILLGIVGIVASFEGYGLLIRIRIDADLRCNQLKYLERKMSNIQLTTVTEAWEFFFENKNISRNYEELNFNQSKYKNKGVRAIDAYKYISMAIIFSYVIMIFFAIIKFGTTICNFWGEIVAMVA